MMREILWWNKLTDLAGKQAGQERAASPQYGSPDTIRPLASIPRGSAMSDTVSTGTAAPFRCSRQAFYNFRVRGESAIDPRFRSELDIAKREGVSEISGNRQTYEPSGHARLGRSRCVSSAISVQLRHCFSMQCTINSSKCLSERNPVLRL